MYGLCAMVHNDTIENILNAAEALFAERGFSETSLRTITSAAGVNLAAVNYHFGSKKELIQAIFARFLTQFFQRVQLDLDRRLNASSGSGLTLEEILSCVVDSASYIDKERRERGAPVQFMRLIGLAYTQGQGHIKEFIINEYGESYRGLIDQLKTSASNLGSIEFFWRIHFVLGAAVFAMSGFDALQAIALTEYNEEVDVETVLTKLVPVAAAMLRAEM
jgi:AcrR family transcriptional regulator